MPNLMRNEKGSLLEMAVIKDTYYVSFIGFKSESWAAESLDVCEKADHGIRSVVS